MTSADDNIRLVFVSRKTAAALLEISPDTFDQWVRSGFIPPAAVNRGQIIRWHWPTVEAKLAERPSNVESDPFKLPDGPYVRKPKPRKPRAPRALVEPI
ncbi:hypothetical protein [Ancylobacter oerskovii]|uniref:Helix-turn-helix domain-containing protein n=1 Tax=Ancylobacter oerskovii TaxID=459519 RepID=A0ABW4Z3R0_9HYPH|nr:hypothetical protein [Ancylobacter oerskovii]MBS7546282.1 hypothetical protein [Ancylobacter oerskovii]